MQQINTYPVPLFFLLVPSPSPLQNHPGNPVFLTMSNTNPNDSSLGYFNIVIVMKYTIPNDSLVLLIGVSSSGKSSFAKKHFKSTEILSSDFFRAMVTDDENNQEASKDAFEIVLHVADKRLSLKRLTVIDATNVAKKARKGWLNLAKKHHQPIIAILLNTPLPIVEKRHGKRDDRPFHFDIIRKQLKSLEQSLPHLALEGFNQIITLTTVEEITDALFIRQ